ncbi:MAG: heparan-alpha-glucosaminide N-acetyltransferase domain-containing protein [Ruminococcus sp.]
MTSERYTLPDIIRGFALIEMMIYHGLWDLVFVFGINITWFGSAGCYIWQQSICWIFIFLSGFCVNFSRHKLKRALTVLICSAVISIVTIIAMPYAAVKFGVLTLIGSGMLFMIPLDKLFSKVPPFAGAAVSMLLFVFTRNVPFGYLGFEKLNIISLPQSLYCNIFTAYLGFPPADFSSSDYFSLVPWFFLFSAGYFTYHIFRKYDLFHILSPVKIPPIEWLGRHSLVIYMIHQPLIYGILWLTAKAAGA